MKGLKLLHKQDCRITLKESITVADEHGQPVQTEIKKHVLKMPLKAWARKTDRVLPDKCTAKVQKIVAR